ncbi:MAG: hypothetical protein L0Y68_08245 [Candidatus Dadabacteria bacterium]|nr:hypothetical protein [Candidatus Dadabacteria bacterium]
MLSGKKEITEVSHEELFNHSEKRMPYFMIPRFIRFVDALLKTPPVRVRKHILKEEGTNPNAWDMEKAG